MHQSRVSSVIRAIFSGLEFAEGKDETRKRREGGRESGEKVAQRETARRSARGGRGNGKSVLLSTASSGGPMGTRSDTAVASNPPPTGLCHWSPRSFLISSRLEGGTRREGPRGSARGVGSCVHTPKTIVRGGTLKVRVAYILDPRIPPRAVLERDKSSRSQESRHDPGSGCR